MVRETAKEVDCMLVKDVMTAHPVTVTEETPIFQAMDVMRRQKFGRLLVTRGDELVGIVTELDLMRVSPSAATTLSRWEQNELLGKMKVRQVMTRKPLTINPNDTVEEAARLMCEKRISGLPVVDAGQVVGIVTERDLFQAFVNLMHGAAPGARLTLEVKNQVGVLADIARLISDAGINILAVAADSEKKGYSQLVLKLDTEEPTQIVSQLESAGYKVIHQALGGTTYLENGAS